MPHNGVREREKKRVKEREKEREDEEREKVFEVLLLLGPDFTGSLFIGKFKTLEQKLKYGKENAGSLK